MMFKKLKHEYFSDILLLWNSQTNPIFTIREDLFESQIVTDKSINYDLSQVVFVENQIIGFMIIKTSSVYEIQGLSKTVWISLLFVDTNFRFQKIGSKLLSTLKSNLHLRKYSRIVIGQDVHNLFCGVPTIFDNTSFFIKNGFQHVGYAYDMNRKVTKMSTLALLQRVPYEIGIATTSDFNNLEDFFVKNFNGRWLFEFQEYRQLGGSGREFIILKREQQIIAFCRINDCKSIQNMYNTNWDNLSQNLIGIGPLGVDTDYRNLGLGYDVVAYTVNEAIKRDASDIIIDWTGLVDFYALFGFDIFMKYSCFEIKIPENKEVYNNET